MLALCGVLVALALRYLPGQGRPLPRRRLQGGRGPGEAHRTARHLLRCPGDPRSGRGAGAGGTPDRPWVAGWPIVAVRLAKRDAPQQALLVLAAAGSFAAVSTLLGSPLLGAFLLMEASGLGGPTLGLVLLPGPAGLPASGR